MLTYPAGPVPKDGLGLHSQFVFVNNGGAGKYVYSCRLVLTLMTRCLDKYQHLISLPI